MTRPTAAALILFALFALVQSQAFVDDLTKITPSGIKTYLYSPEEGKWAKLHSNGKLGMTPLAEKAELFEVFEVTANTSYRIFSTTLQLWVSAEERGKKSLRATRPVARSWETFSINYLDKYTDKYHLQPIQTLYLTAVNGRVVTIQDQGTLVSSTDSVSSAIKPIRLALRWALPFNGAACVNDLDCQSGQCNGDYYNGNSSRSCRETLYSSVGAPCGLSPGADNITGFCPQEIGQPCSVTHTTDCKNVCDGFTSTCQTSSACIDAESLVTLHNGTVSKAKHVIVGDVLLGAEGMPNFVSFIASSPLSHRKMMSINGGDFVFTENHLFSDGLNCLTALADGLTSHFCSKLTIGSTIRSFKNNIWSDEVVHSMEFETRNVSVLHFYTVSDSANDDYESSGFLTFGGYNIGSGPVMMHLALPRLIQMFGEESESSGPLYKGVTPLVAVEDQTITKASEIWAEISEEISIEGEPIYNDQWIELSKTMALQNSRIVGSYHDIALFTYKMVFLTGATNLVSRPPTPENVDILRSFGNRVMDELQRRLETSTGGLTGIHFPELAHSFGSI